MTLAARARPRLADIDTARLSMDLRPVSGAEKFWTSPRRRASGGQSRCWRWRAPSSSRASCCDRRAHQGPGAGHHQPHDDAFANSRRAARPSCWWSRTSTSPALGDSVAVMDDGRIVHRGRMRKLAEDEALQTRLTGPFTFGPPMNRAHLPCCWCRPGATAGTGLPWWAACLWAAHHRGGWRWA